MRVDGPAAGATTVGAIGAKPGTPSPDQMK
jgi:hypothetical protein